MMKLAKLFIQAASILWLMALVVTITSSPSPPTPLWAALALAAIVLPSAYSVVDKKITASKRGAGSMGTRIAGSERQMGIDA
jgi:hypothetical protein